MLKNLIKNFKGSPKSTHTGALLSVVTMFISLLAFAIGLKNPEMKAYLEANITEIASAIVVLITTIIVVFGAKKDDAK